MSNSNPRSRNPVEYKASPSTATLFAHDYPQLVDDYMNNSFFLPFDIIKKGSWKVEPIRVISGSDFRTVVAMHAARELRLEASIGMKSVKLVYEGANKHMLLAAKKVGVSERYNLMTDTTVLVCKIWYGNSNGKEGVAA